MGSDQPLFPLSHFLSRIPPARGGKRASPAFLARAVLKGTRAPNGDRIKLQAVRCGSRWLTTHMWFDEWLAAQTAAHLEIADGPAATVVRPPAARQRASEEAATELVRMGC